MEILVESLGFTIHRPQEAITEQWLFLYGKLGQKKESTKLFGDSITPTMLKAPEALGNLGNGTGHRPPSVVGPTLDQPGDGKVWILVGHSSTKYSELKGSSPEKFGNHWRRHQ